MESNDKNIENSGDDFSFTLLNGEEKNLSDYRGKIVVVDFFGVYCTPCQQEMLQLHKLYENYSSEDIEIISIDVWIYQGETPGLVKQFIDLYKSELNINLSWVFGVDDHSMTLLKKYNIEGVPTIIIFDRKGNIYKKFEMYTEYSVLAKNVEKLI